MKQRVELELQSDLMCGGVRVSDNFLESEPFIRGSVLRAAFAKQILLECPLGDVPSPDGKLHYVMVKDADGICADCPKRKVCEKFSEMRFSYAYIDGAFPAPFTARVCKTCGTAHPVQDTLVCGGMIRCSGCTDGLKRMESAKGFWKAENGAYRQVKPKIHLTTHTGIDRYTDTAKKGSLFSIRAIQKGTHFEAVIDDAGTDLLSVGDVLYCGKYASNGFGKLKIVKLTPEPECTAETLKARLDKFQNRFRKEKPDAENDTALLFLSDACVEMNSSMEILTDDAYTRQWEKALFGDGNLPFRLKTIVAETQLYSGYDTSQKWGEWRAKTPELHLLRGTSVLLEIQKDRYEEAVQLLLKLQENGIGKKTADGYGQIAVCHEIHCKGVEHNG